MQKGIIIVCILFILLVFATRISAKNDGIVYKNFGSLTAAEKLDRKTVIYNKVLSDKPLDFTESMDLGKFLKDDVKNKNIVLKDVNQDNVIKKLIEQINK